MTFNDLTSKDEVRALELSNFPEMKETGFDSQ